jgi:hypothetical protein
MSDFLLRRVTECRTQIERALEMAPTMELPLFRALVEAKVAIATACDEVELVVEHEQRMQARGLCKRWVRK